MSPDEKKGDSVHVNIQGPVSGQVAAGKEISQVSVTGASGGAVTEADRAELRRLFGELQARVDEKAPPEQKAAATERVQELQAAVTADKPDLTTMEYVRNWFAKRLPSLAGAVGTVVVHPIVGRLVEAAGDAVAAEFRRRFGGQPKT
jgi:hypothetical protein